MTNAVVILSLKGTLVYGLEQALFSIYEEDDLDFTDFLQSGHPEPDNLSQSSPHYLQPRQRYGLHRSSALSGMGDRIFRQISLQKKRRKRSRGNTVIYTSALPQILFANDSFCHSLTLPEISQLIVSRLQKVMLEAIECEPDHNDCVISLISRIWHEFEIETHRPGWIGFHLSQAGIGLWLAHCINQYDISITLHKKWLPIHSTHQEFTQRSAALLWQLQYAHARCCCLLRLWHDVCATPAVSAAALEFDTLEFDTLEFDSSVENNLMVWPWVGADREQAQLVHSLIEMTDHMFWIPYQWHSKQYFLLLERATALYQSLERFCAVGLSGFPGVAQAEAIASIPQFQARFHLIRVVQKTLETLLTTYLDAKAPTSL